MVSFDEEVFLYGLTLRPSETRRFSGNFKPQWLSQSEFQPIMAEIFAFNRKKGEPPSCKTLHKIFRDKDPEAYEYRYKEAIERIEKCNPDSSYITHTLDSAGSVAMARSFHEMTNDPHFRDNIKTQDGTELVRSVEGWLNMFRQAGEDRGMDLKQIIEERMKQAGSEIDSPRIATNIKPLDDWTGGGLRKKQLGIVLAPTGHGKSVILQVIAHKVAIIEHKKVLFITNELSLEEVAERFLSKIAAKPLSEVQDNPGIAFEGLEGHWKNGVHKRCEFKEYNRDVSTDDIEADLDRLKNTKNFEPDVICLDYMERMKPSNSGYERKAEWKWLGAIANDLVRLAKRRNILIWTAGQTNRAGMDDSQKMNMSMAQASVRHLQEATAVVAVRRKDLPFSKDGKENEVGLEFTSLKQRQGKMVSRPIVLRCDLSMMHVANEIIDIQEGVEEDEDTSPLPKTVQEKKAAKKNRGWKV